MPMLNKIAIHNKLNKNVRNSHSNSKFRPIYFERTFQTFLTTLFPMDSSSSENARLACTAISIVD